MVSDDPSGDSLWEAITGGNAAAAAAGAAAGTVASGWEPPRGRRRAHRGSRRRHLTTLLTAVLLLSMVTGSSANGAVCRAGIPAYFYPGTGDGHWPQVSRLAPGTLVIVNPANGPGTAVDPNYLAALDGARRSSPVLYGYVDTAYGQRPDELVLSEAQTWRDWYGVDGIFLDQTSSGPQDVPYYQGLTDRLHGQGFQVALNPGQPQLDPRYLTMAEHIVTFEGPYRQYLQQRFPRPRRAAGAHRTWHLVYEVADERQMRSVVALARRRGAGMVYATDGVMPNPWDRLPPYWPQQQRLLARC